MTEKTKKASILAFTLIMLSIVLIAGISLMSVTLVDTKTASDSNDSIQALQAAESGSSIVIAKLERASSEATIEASVDGCDSGSGEVRGNASQGTFSVKFFNNDGDELGCDALVEDVAKVQSVGSFSQTNRAVEVAMAASGGFLTGGIVVRCDSSSGCKDVNNSLWGVGAQESPSAGYTTSDPFLVCQKEHTLPTQNPVAEDGYNCFPMGVDSTYKEGTNPPFDSDNTDTTVICGCVAD